MCPPFARRDAFTLAGERRLIRYRREWNCSLFFTYENRNAFAGVSTRRQGGGGGTREEQSGWRRRRTIELTPPKTLSPSPAPPSRPRVSVYPTLHCSTGRDERRAVRLFRLAAAQRPEGPVHLRRCVPGTVCSRAREQVGWTSGAETIMATANSTKIDNTGRLQCRP